jgi:hypothetical protein
MLMSEIDTTKRERRVTHENIENENERTFV